MFTDAYMLPVDKCIGHKHTKWQPAQLLSFLIKRERDESSSFESCLGALCVSSTEALHKTEQSTA